MRSVNDTVEQKLGTAKNVFDNEFRILRILGKHVDLIPIRSSYGNPLHSPDAMGKYDRSKHVIYFDLDQDVSQYKDTLIHEVLHHLDSELKLDLSENQVCRLSVGLYALMHDNPEFAEWWIK